eukprot:4528688-Amphidinium_carterae.1
MSAFGTLVTISLRVTRSSRLIVRSVGCIVEGPAPNGHHACAWGRRGGPTQHAQKIFVCQCSEIQLEQLLCIINHSARYFCGVLVSMCNRQMNKVCRKQWRPSVTHASATSAVHWRVNWTRYRLLQNNFALLPLDVTCSNDSIVRTSRLAQLGPAGR